MGRLVLIYGKSGSGKSRSLKNFAEDEILLINVVGKELPFRKKFKFVLNSRNYKTIKSQLAKMPLKAAVIDDAGYLMTDKFMREHSAGRKGKEVYDLYNEIGDEFYFLIDFIRNTLPEDVIVYVMMHENMNDDGNTQLKTIGRMLDEKCCIEGLSTICLRCMSEDGKHFFKTVTNGQDISKSPEEMFESEEIENDLKAVDTAIREYYGLISDEIEANDTESEENK